MTWKEAYNRVMEIMKEFIEELKEEGYTEDEDIFTQVDHVISDVMTDLGYSVMLTRLKKQ